MRSILVTMGRQSCTAGPKRPTWSMDCCCAGGSPALISCKSAILPQPPACVGMQVSRSGMVHCAQTSCPLLVLLQVIDCLTWQRSMGNRCLLLCTGT